MVLKEQRDIASACSVLCQSVSEYPLNWSAWMDLASIVTTKDMVSCIPNTPNSLIDYL